MIKLRQATMEDAELLFKWKNDPDTIAISITNRGVTMEEHTNWLRKVIDNPKCHLFVLEVEQVPVGQLRLDLEVLDNTEENGNLTSQGSSSLTAEISYGLAAEHRGKGLGIILLKQVETLAERFYLKQLTAEVLPHNVVSQKLFRSLGFVEEQKENLYVYTKRYF